MTNDETLANDSLALAEEIAADARREIARLDALIVDATAAQDFDVVGFLLLEKSFEEFRVGNAEQMRAAALEFKSCVGQRH